MTEKRLYTCEFCHTDYADKEQAEKCEAIHIPIDRVEIKGDYRPYGQSGFPIKIRLHDPLTKKMAVYKLC